MASVVFVGHGIKYWVESRISLETKFEVINTTVFIVIVVISYTVRMLLEQLFTRRDQRAQQFTQIAE